MLSVSCFALLFRNEALWVQMHVKNRNKSICPHCDVCPLFSHIITRSTALKHHDFSDIDIKTDGEPGDDGKCWLSSQTAWAFPFLPVPEEVRTSPYIVYPSIYLSVYRVHRYVLWLLLGEDPLSSYDLDCSLFSGNRELMPVSGTETRSTKLYPELHSRHQKTLIHQTSNTEQLTTENRTYIV